MTCSYIKYQGAQNTNEAHLDLQFSFPYVKLLATLQTNKLCIAQGPCGTCNAFAAPSEKIKKKQDLKFLTAHFKEQQNSENVETCTDGCYAKT